MMVSQSFPSVSAARLNVRVNKPCFRIWSFLAPTSIQYLKYCIRYMVFAFFHIDVKLSLPQALYQSLHISYESGQMCTETLACVQAGGNASLIKMIILPSRLSVFSFLFLQYVVIVVGIRN